MPNCHWYCTQNDHPALLSRIIAQGSVDVMELYSANNQAIRTFGTVGQALAAPEFGRIHLNLWHRTASPRYEITRSQRNVGTWFERSGALGFVQFYLEFLKDRQIDHSHTNTVSPARMGAVDGIFRDTTGADWDVGAVNHYSAWLNRQIKKMAVALFMNAYVLPGADQHWQSGRIYGTRNCAATTHSKLYRPIS